jgi:hypothetical protein
MGSIVGFSLFNSLESRDAKRLLASQEQALSYFKHLERKSIPLGLTRLEVWGHSEISERLHTMPDGSLLALVGSPHGEINWPKVQETLSNNEKTADFELPGMDVWSCSASVRMAGAGRCGTTGWAASRSFMPRSEAGASPPRLNLSSSPQPGTPLTISSCRQLSPF